MAFSPACTKAAAPKVFLVDRFVGQVGQPPPTEGLADYPTETTTKLKELFEKELGRLERRTAKDGPDAKNVPRLFTIERVKSLQDVPKLLQSGDVILAAIHLPDVYSVDQMADDSASAPVSLMKDVIQKRIEESWAELDKSWAKVKDAKKIPVRPKAVTDEAGQDPGLSWALHQVHTVGKRNIFWSLRIGLIDVGWPAIDATRIFSQDPVRTALRAELAGGEAENPSLGPAAVAAASNSSDAVKSKRDVFLKTVGKGLAYNFLHEFVHATCGQPGHPFGSGSEEIEGRPRSTGDADLHLKKEAIASIHRHYEETWCDDVTSKRTSAEQLGK
jgi:hypothetical protein